MSYRPPRILRNLSLFAALFAFGLVMFGAFVRLSNAGLSCPDWPTCYGQVTWPKLTQTVAKADTRFPNRPYEAHKAWREQLHRLLAGTLGVLVLAMALLAAWKQRWARLAVIGSALLAVVGVSLYMRGEHMWASILAILAMALPLFAAMGLKRPGAWRISLVILSLIIFQAMLGMWTVTLLLKPIVVLGHLLGGMTSFALLSWVGLRYAGVGAHSVHYAGLRKAVMAGIILLACQIALGGWTSANYASLACGYGPSAFPQCLGQWLPPTDYHQGFILWRNLKVSFEGGILDQPARTAIQMTHRFGALLLFAYLLALAYGLVRRGLHLEAIAITLVLLAQVSLGISNVVFGLPLTVATLHNGCAALLLFTLVWSLARTQPHHARRMFDQLIPHA